MSWTVEVPPTRPWHRRASAAALVVAAVAQLIGQLLLRLPSSDPGSDIWIVAHVVLVIAALALLVVGLTILVLVGSTASVWAGLIALVVGQSLLLAVLAIDLGVASVEVDAVRTLDTWDFLGVVGIVVLLLELRRRKSELGLGAALALLGLAVPPVEGLVVVAAGAVAIGFAVLAYDLVAGRGQTPPVWLAVVVAVAYAATGTVSWPRAALAVVVLAWTVHGLRGGPPGQRAGRNTPGLAPDTPHR